MKILDKVWYKIESNISKKIDAFYFSIPGYGKFIEDRYGEIGACNKTGELIHFCVVYNKKLGYFKVYYFMNKTAFGYKGINKIIGIDTL